MAIRVDLDAYAYQESPIHRWEPRYKLIGLVALIFTFAFVNDVQLLPFMLLTVTVLYAASKLPVSYLLSRLRYPGFFLIGIVGLLPFLSGRTVIWQWGMLSLRQEGCLATALIATRFFSIFTLGLILLSTMSFMTTVRTLRSLGLPAILADMTLLTYRYLYDIAGNLSTMRIGMQLRGFRSQKRSAAWLIPNWLDLKRLASLAGTLLIRSYEQSEHVYKAMRLRGYGQDVGEWGVGSREMGSGKGGGAGGHGGTRRQGDAEIIHNSRYFLRRRHANQIQNSPTLSTRRQLFHHSLISSSPHSQSLLALILTLLLAVGFVIADLFL